MVKWSALFHRVKYGKTPREMTQNATQFDANHDTGGC